MRRRATEKTRATFTLDDVRFRRYVASQHAFAERLDVGISRDERPELCCRRCDRMHEGAAQVLVEICGEALLAQREGF